MKTKYYLLLAISLILVMAYSCRKDLVNEMPVKPETVQWAKDHFNNVLSVNNGSFVKIASTSTSTTSNQKPNRKTPWWGRATANKTNLFEFVEVPLFYSRKIITLISKKDDPIDMEIAKASFDRLIIFKDKKGNIDQRIVSFIPDKDYLRKHNGDISHNKIDKLDKDFTGYLLYKNWEGKTVNKLRIINGKAKSFSKKISAISTPIKLNKIASTGNAVSSSPGYEGQPGCTDYYMVTYTTFCYYEGDNPTPLYCDAPEMTDIEYTRTECPSDPDEEEGCANPANFNNPECNGGGTINEEEDWGPAGVFGAADEGVTTTEYANETAAYKTKFVNTVVYTAGSNVRFRAYEKIELVKYVPLIGHWMFDSITHLSLQVEGTMLGITIEPVINFTNGTVYNHPGSGHYNNSYARMQYSFKDKRSKSVNGEILTKTSGDINGFNTWYLANLGIGPND